MIYSSESHPAGQSETHTEDRPHPDQTIETLTLDLTQELHPLRQINGTPISILQQPEILERCLLEAYTYFSSQAEESLVITYGGEWLLDNYFIVQRAIEQLTKNMPPRYYVRLPKIAGGNFAGFAHVYVLAQALIHHVQSRVTIEEQRHFVDVYQQHNSLKIGELWAWPTMLRITVLETLVGAISQLIESEESFEKTLVAPIFRERFPIFKDPDLIVANCVTSLRAIDAYDWSDFVEEASYVEKILQRDPAEIYTRKFWGLGNCSDVMFLSLRFSICTRSAFTCPFTLCVELR
jgi:cyclic beta-1,2-glucan synthetase